MSALDKPETTERFFATIEEYLYYEETSLEKHDYLVGEVVVHAGGSADHNSIEAI